MKSLGSPQHPSVLNLQFFEIDTFGTQREYNTANNTNAE